MNTRRFFMVASVAIVALVAAQQSGLLGDKSDKMPMTEVVHAQQGDITIADGYVRTNGATASNGAAFFTILNMGGTDDRLIAATASFARKAEIHEHIADGDIMLMREKEGGVPVSGAGHAMLMRGGDHVMFMGLNGPVAEGSTVTLTLTFENAGDIAVDLPVDSKRKPAMMAH
jgi:copper(I)-binding protein